MFSPYVLIGALVGAILLAATSFGAGIKVEGNHRDALALKAEQLAEQQIKQEQDKAAAASAALEQAKQNVQTRTEVITKTVDKIVLRRIYKNVCLDSDGISAANMALSSNGPSKISSDKGG